MEDNNLNQNNQVGNVQQPDMTINQNTVVPTPSPTTYGQYQAPTQTTQTNLGEVKASPKKSGPLIIFGIVFIVSIALVVTLLLENRGSNGGDNSKLINDETKTIIVYFSKDGENYGKNLDMSNKMTLNEGNTKLMAQSIASLIDADTFELEPAVPYPEDLKELYDATKIEYNKDIYPEIKDEIQDLDSYDVVFIGYPIWHASYPQIIKTFVRDNKDVLKNKIIVPFNTHAGSGSAGTYKKLFNLIGIPEEKGLNGLAINGTEVTTSEENIKNWLKGIGYNIK